MEHGVLELRLLWNVIGLQSPQNIFTVGKCTLSSILPMNFYGFECCVNSSYYPAICVCCKKKIIRIKKKVNITHGLFTEFFSYKYIIILHILYHIWPLLVTV